MTKKTYLKILAFFSAHTKLKQFFLFVQKGLELLIYICYPVFLVCLYIADNNFYLWSAILCLSGLILTSLIRKLINAKRPYEIFEVSPIIKKQTRGNSFPSRHVFSATVIAMNVMAVYPPVGTLLLICALIIAVLRVVLGVHFIKDVVAGAVLGLAFGTPALFLI